jgi:hypothetical protein
MKTVPRAVLSASLFRLLSFLAKRLTPVVLLAYRNNISWVDFVARRTHMVQSSTYDAHRTGTDRLQTTTLLDVNAIQPRLLPYDADLLRWVVDGIVNMIDGLGSTFGVPAVRLAVDIIATHCPTLGGQVLVFCDGCEYYGQNCVLLTQVRHVTSRHVL